MVPRDGSPPSVVRPACRLCGRLTFDPDKRGAPWARGVAARVQVLICPSCQADRPDWAEGLDACERCGGRRLSSILGTVVCRACGHEQGA